MIKKELKIEDYSYYYSINRCENEVIEPIIFINGAFQCMKSWGKVANKFSGQTTTIVADLPGWGTADFLPEEYDFNFLAKAIFQILEAESIEKINVVSTSYGTPIAASFSRNYPGYVSNLVLSSPILEMDSFYIENHKKLLSLIQNENAHLLADFLVEIGLLNNHEGQKGNVRQFNLIKEVFTRNLSRLDDESIKKFICNTQRIINAGTISLDGISQLRMLSFTGEFDGFTSARNCLKAALLFPQGNFTTIKNADHLFLSEQLDTTYRLLSTFFSGSSLEQVDGCSNTFSLQNENEKSKRVLKQFESAPRHEQTLIQPLSVPVEFLQHPSMSQVSFGTP